MNEAMNAFVRWHPQWEDGKIVRYSVYAWDGHPLLGEIRGTRQYASTEREIKKIARDMRETILRRQGVKL